MNSIRQFTLLEDLEKCQILWNNGIPLARHSTGSYTISLFDLELFYVEIFYNQDTDRICYINTFSELSPLDKYLDQISLEQLMAG